MAKTDTHLGVVKVPDERLDRCAALFSPKSTVHATIEFVDVAGLKKGASGTTQCTTSFLSAVKNNDALIQVVRLFRNDAVPHPDGSIDPLRDVATLRPSSFSPTWRWSNPAWRRFTNRSDTRTTIR